MKLIVQFNFIRWISFFVFAILSILLYYVRHMALIEHRAVLHLMSGLIVSLTSSCWVLQWDQHLCNYLQCARFLSIDKTSRINHLRTISLEVHQSGKISGLGWASLSLVLHYSALVHISLNGYDILIDIERQNCSLDLSDS